MWNNRKCGIVIDICDGNDLYFSPASCVPDLATKTGRHDIAEILLNVALKHQKSKKNIPVCNNNKVHLVILARCVMSFRCIFLFVLRF